MNLLCCLVATLVTAEPEVLPEVTLTRSNGQLVQLSALFGKPAILFFESPASATMNQAAKLELKRLSEVHRLRDSVDVIGVAGLEGLNWWPARPIAMGLVRDEERKNELTVAIDWQGSLRHAPWKIDPKISTVMVVSPTGQLLFRADGKLETAQLEELKAALGRLLPAVAGS